MLEQQRKKRKQKKSGVDMAHEEKDVLEKTLKKQSMPAMAETLEDMDFESLGVKQVNGTTMETFKKEYGNIVTVVSTWQKGDRTGSAVKIFNKGHEEIPTGVLHNMNMHGVIWTKGQISDAASRQLTGDCKIRVRKETTEDAKRYNPGDISEKTRLQKQNDGTWAKPKTATNAGGSDNQSAVNNVKVGQKVKFTFKGRPYSGTVEQVGKNAIKFTSSNGKPMMFRKDSIEGLNVSSPAKEKPYRAPGPVHIPGDDPLLHNGL